MDVIIHLRQKKVDIDFNGINPARLFSCILYNQKY